ncbi:MAG: DUF1549 domain-containing protein, partial [Verrucomicrobiales bacterium]|nr:DUF1549 domain-containing protein [Verrucomicrobiales bacterium]
MHPRRLSSLAVVGVVCRMAFAAAWGAIVPPGFEQARAHWSLRPVVRPTVPEVRASARVRTPVDAFLLSKLESKGLDYAPEPDPRTLLRRLYFDLIGVPPTYEEIAAFGKDPSDAAWAAT